MLAISGKPLRHAFVVELEEQRDVVKRVIAAGLGVGLGRGLEAADAGDDAVYLDAVKQTRVEKMVSRAKQRPLNDPTDTGPRTMTKAD